MLQISSKFWVPCQIKEAGEGPHLKPSAVGVEALEPELAAVLNDLLEYWVEDVGVVPGCQLRGETGRVSTGGGVV